MPGKGQGKTGRIVRFTAAFLVGRNKDGSPQSYSEDSVVFSTTPESAELYNWMATWPGPEKPYEEAWAEGWDPTWNHKDGQIQLAAVHMGQNAVDAKHDVLKLKLFHNRTPYWEAFLNLDLEEGSVDGALSLNEKDPEFRNALRDSLRNALVSKPC